MRGRGSRGLRSGEWLSWTQEERGRSGHIHRDLRYEDGAGRGPNLGSTSAGRTSPVPRARTSTCTSGRTFTGTSAVRIGPARSSACDLLSAVVTILRGAYVGEEADEDLQKKDGSGEEPCQCKEDPGQAQEALSETES
jgi:hypothetical protein